MSAKFAEECRCILLLFSMCLIGSVFNLPVRNLAGMPNASTQSESSYKFRVEVELTTVEVIALDKKGNPIRNLKKEDFQLYEDGKKQEILSIDEMNEESRTSALGASPIDEKPLHPGKTVLIVFDDGSIKPQYIKASRDSAQRFVQEHMRPQDLFAVAVYGISMKILQNFTSNREEVLRVIKQSTGVNAAGGAMYFENLLRWLDGISNSIAQIKGQKSFLIYSQSMYSGMDTVTMGARGLSRISGTLSDTYKKTLASARKSNASFHIIDPEALNIPAPAGLSLKSFAADSGGSIIGMDIDAELDKLDKQISNYYILGFQSNNPRHYGAFRKLEIKTDLRGVTLKHQSGYLDRRPIDVLASSKQEQTLLAALASPGAATQLPIIFRPAYFYDSPRIARVLVAAKIRMEKMAFKKKSGQMGTDLNLMGIAYAEDGSIAARFSETLPIVFDKEKEGEFRKRNLAYRNYFKLRPGKYRLKLAASDESNNLGSAEQFLEVPALPDKGFAGSSIVLVEQTSQLPGLIQNLQTQLLNESDPLIYSGLQIEPRVENRLPVNSSVPVLFSIYNLPGRSDQWELVAKAKLLDEKGEGLALNPIFLKKLMFPTSNSGVVVGINLEFKGVSPGKYRLFIEITELASSQSAMLQTDLEFTN